MSLVTKQATTVAPDAWAAVGDLPFVSEEYSNVLLADGRVLLAGGSSAGSASSAIASAAIFNPATDTWAAANAMGSTRYLPAMTLLADGRVLVMGGDALGVGIVLASCEIFDPATGLWTATGDLLATRAMANSVLLSTGEVLCCGGRTTGGINVGTAELYNPASGTWRAAPSMNSARRFCPMVTLLDGRVFAISGQSVNSPSTRTAICETYDATSNTWTRVADIPVALAAHGASVLADGRVLAGGGSIAGGSRTGALFLYDPDADSWETLSDTIPTPCLHSRPNAFVTLPDGRVLIPGGSSASNTVTTETRIFDPVSGRLTLTSTPTRGRYQHQPLLLNDGRVLCAGGHTTPAFAVSATCEVFSLATVPTVSGPSAPDFALVAPTSDPGASGRIYTPRDGASVQVNSGGLSGSTSVEATLAELHSVLR